MKQSDRIFNADESHNHSQLVPSSLFTADVHVA